MPETETSIPTINSFYDTETSTEYAVEDTVARARSEAAQEAAEAAQEAAEAAQEAAEAAQEAAEAAQEAAGAGIVTDPLWVQHRNTYRGKSLGDTYTDEQRAMVAAGTFDDLFIGDYWTIGNFDWMIADINYWFNTGDHSQNKVCTTPHLVIVPKIGLYKANMNASNTTAGGYINSKLFTQNLNDAKTMIYTAFEENYVLNHAEYFTNAVTNGIASGEIWVDSKIDLMNQIMVYGSMIFPGSPSSNVVPNNFTIDKTQLSLFRLRPDLITVINDVSYWLRDVVSSTNFALVGGNGDAGTYSATGSAFIRPIFGLIG